MNTTRPWWTLLPSGLLLGVAVAQMLTANLSTLSPWKGGGYGMFATQDSPGARFLELTGRTASGEPVRLSVSGEDLHELSLPATLLSRLRAFPRAADLSRLANALLPADLVDARTSGLTTRSHLLALDPRLADLLPSIAEDGRRTLTPVRPDSPGHAEAPRESVHMVSATVWRMRVDPGRDRVVFERLVGPIEFGGP